jgi:hypothetical protein
MEALSNTGPRRRGTGGTLIWAGKSHRDRGHPPKRRKYDQLFTNPNADTRKSILYHLNHMESIQQVNGWCAVRMARIILERVVR